MSKHMGKTPNTAHLDGVSESQRLLAIEDIARQIAVLVVRQHRRLKAEGGKKRDENAL